MDDRRSLDMIDDTLNFFEDVVGGWRCPECNSYLEQDDKWLYCLNCGYDEEEEAQDSEDID